jgi:hypothetical protein
LRRKAVDQLKTGDHETGDFLWKCAQRPQPEALPGRKLVGAGVAGLQASRDGARDDW